MVPQKIIGPQFRLYDAKGDLNKKWFIEWREGPLRKKKYGDINSGVTVGDRRKLARKLMQDLRREQKRKVTQTETAVYKVVAAMSPGWSKKTRQDYASKYKALLEWLSGDEINPERMNEFFVHLSKTLHQTTVNKYRTVLKMLFTKIGMEYLFDDIQNKRAIRTPKRYFQSHQMSMLCQEIMFEDEDLWLFIQLMYYCFLRPGEIRQLKISDIEFDDWVIYVRGDVAKNDKTKAVSIPDQFIPEMRKLMGRKPNELIFPGVRGTMLGRNTMYTRFKKLLKEHDYGDEYSLYSVRHTGAVAAAKVGASMKELQIQFRHHSLSQTDEYLRQLGIEDVVTLRKIHPNILSNHRIKPSV